MNADFPQIIKDVGFDFIWSEEKVWALAGPVEDMALAELVWHFDIPFLWKEGGVYDLTPREVLDNPETYQKEHERTMRADLAYPIDIMRNKGHWLILDGRLRLMKASVFGMYRVQVRKIPRKRIPEITK